MKKVSCGEKTVFSTDPGGLSKPAITSNRLWSITDSYSGAGDPICSLNPHPNTIPDSSTDRDRQTYIASHRHGTRDGSSQHFTHDGPGIWEMGPAPSSRRSRRA